MGGRAYIFILSQSLISTRFCDVYARKQNKKNSLPSLPIMLSLHKKVQAHLKHLSI